VNERSNPLWFIAPVVIAWVPPAALLAKKLAEAYRTPSLCSCEEFDLLYLISVVGVFSLAITAALFRIRALRARSSARLALWGCLVVIVLYALSIGLAPRGLVDW